MARRPDDRRPRHRAPFAIGFLLVAIGMVVAPSSPASAAGSPAAVTLAGDFQSELGCGSDWDPGCATTHLVRSAVAPIWSATFTVPAGTWSYKIAVDDSWTVNYGAGGVANGTQITLVLHAATTLRFYFDENTHWLADSHNDSIATVAGSFQSELGCPADHQPDCLVTLLEDRDGDGVATLTAEDIPAGSYTLKVTMNESWDVHYGVGGSRTGTDIPLVVPAGAATTFAFNERTHVLSSTPSHFIDVNGTNTFRADIEWMVSANITTGYPDSSFHPSASVERQAMAAFLYRAKGSPNGTRPTCHVAPYTDVPVTSLFCGEIAWMKSTGITTGFPGGTFHPAAVVQREAMAAFLYRATHAPGAHPTCTVAPFTDVPTTSTFCGQIAWMKAAGITTGYAGGTFRPGDAVERQAMAAFLHRLSLPQ